MDPAAVRRQKQTYARHDIKVFQRKLMFTWRKSKREYYEALLSMAIADLLEAS